MSKQILTLAILALLGAGVYSLRRLPSAPAPTPSPASSATVAPESVSLEAAFLIFTRGTRRDFTDARYHNLSPAVYLTADNPAIVHVRSAPATWQQFFDTLPMQLSAECLVTGTKQTFCSDDSVTLKFYLNGTADPQALTRKIGAGDRLLVTYGTDSEAEINRQLGLVPNP